MFEFSRSVLFALSRPAVIVAAVATLAVPVSGQVEWSAFQSRKSHGIAYDTARQMLVMYGGQASGAQALDETREFVQGRWQLRLPGITPGGLSGHSTIYHPGIGVVVFGGTQPNGTRTNETWVFDGNSWGNQGQPARPPARAAHAMAYDPVRGVSVMFGGGSQSGNLDDTWEYNGTWVRRFPSVLPPARSGHGMAYDSITGGVLMAGGETGGPQGSYFVWTWDGTDWTQRGSLPPNAIVGALNYHGCSLVRSHDGIGVTLVGGTGMSPPFESDNVLRWDGVNWNTLPPGPSPRGFQSATRDSQRNVVVVHGGGNVADTWEWNGTSWQQVDHSPAGLPGRCMTYDRVRNELLVFGGWFGETRPDTSLWVLQAGVWRRVPMVSAWDFGAMAFDEHRGVAVYYGGSFPVLGGGQTLVPVHLEFNSATSAFGGGSGSRPSPRYEHCMTYDSHRCRVVLYGGGNPGGLYDTWEYDGVGWSSIATATLPISSRGSMCYDRRNQRVTMHCGGFPSGSIWTWDGLDWAHRSTSGPHRGTIAYDESRERVVLLAPPVGGATGPGTTWEWDGTQWQPRSTALSPVPGPIAYDTENHRIVAFTPDGTTWEYGPTNPAIATTFGTTCSPLGTTLQWADLPWVGDTAVAELQTPSTPGVAIGVFGFSNQTWSGVPLPISLSPLGLGATCALHVEPAATAVFGTPRWGLPIPNQVAWIGAEFFLQAAVFEGAAPAGIATTNALRAVVGSR